MALPRSIFCLVSNYPFNPCPHLPGVQLPLEFSFVSSAKSSRTPFLSSISYLSPLFELHRARPTPLYPYSTCMYNARVLYLTLTAQLTRSFHHVIGMLHTISFFPVTSLAVYLNNYSYPSKPFGILLFFLDLKYARSPLMQLPTPVLFSSSHLLIFCRC